MKTRKKLLIALLSATCLTAGACAFTACSDQPQGGSTDDNQGAASDVYNSYVQAAANGSTTLTYEEWLASIKGSNGNDGANGTDGATWLTGAGAPSADSGNAGDLYLNTATCDVYKKGVEAWEKIANIKGSTGAQGLQGVQGESAYDLYVDGLGDNDAIPSEDDWQESLIGATGNGIASTRISDDGLSLIVTYTDKTENVIPLSSIFHVHTYGEVTTVIEPTLDNIGIGIKVCSYDGHSELVTLPKLEYTVKVLLPDGKTPASGVKVYIGDGEATTDEKGVAIVNDFGKSDDYDIIVDAGSSYTYDAVTTGTDISFTINLIKVTTGTGSETDPYVLDLNNSLQSETFGIQVNYAVDSEGNGGAAEMVTKIINTTNEAATYTLTIDDADMGVYGHLYSTPHAGSLTQDTNDPFSVVLDAGETYTFVLSVDPFYNKNGFVYKEESSYPVNYNVTLSRSAAPERGTMEFAYDVEEGANTQTVAAGSTQYFRFDNYAQELTFCTFTFTFNIEDLEDDLTILNLGTDYDNLNNAEGTPVVSGTSFKLNNYYPTYFAVTSVSGNISFNVEANFIPGSSAHPIEITELNNEYTATVTFKDEDTHAYWYKYTNEGTETVKYTAVPTNSGGNSTNIAVYDNVSGDSLASSQSGLKVYFEIPAGETRYLKVTNSANSGNIGVLLRLFDETQDTYGDSYDTPLDISNQINTTTRNYVLDDDNHSAKYFTFTTTTPGYYTFDLTCHYDGDFSIQIGSGFNSNVADYVDYGTARTLYTTPTKLYILIRAAKSGDTASGSKPTKKGEDGWFDLSITRETITVDYSINVQCADQSAVSGLTVNLKKPGETEYYATATTNESGIATFTSIISDYYDIEISGYDTEIYAFTTIQTNFAEENATQNVTLSKLNTVYTFTIYDPDGNTYDDATITLTDDSGATVTTVSTSENGVYTTEGITSGIYNITVTGISDYIFNGAKTSGSVFSQEIHLKGVNVISSLTTSNVLKEGTNNVTFNTIQPAKLYFKFEGEGTYEIVLDPNEADYCVINALYYNASASENAILSAGAVDTTSDYASNLTVDSKDYYEYSSTSSTKGYKKIRITIGQIDGVENPYITLMIQSSGTNNSKKMSVITITKVEE
jgi:hypothetical protein